MDILSGIDILSSETGQVFYDHAIDPSSLNIVQHALKGWTVKIRPCISIVYTNGDNIKFRLILQKVQNKLLLVGNAVALTARLRRNDVFLGKTHIDGGIKHSHLIRIILHNLTPLAWSICLRSEYA